MTPFIRETPQKTAACLGRAGGFLHVIFRRKHYDGDQRKSEYRALKDTRRLERSLGTLGGGNHFIEIDEAADGTKYLIIHSGSRNLGKQVAEHYQRLAVDLNRGIHLVKDNGIIRRFSDSAVPPD